MGAVLDFKIANGLMINMKRCKLSVKPCKSKGLSLNKFPDLR